MGCYFDVGANLGVDSLRHRDWRGRRNQLATAGKVYDFRVPRGCYTRRVASSVSGIHPVNRRELSPRMQVDVFPM